MRKIVNENKYFILILLIIFIVMTIKLPYYIEAPGGLINVNNRYVVDDEYESKGSINMTYVSEYRANIASFLVAKLNKDLDLFKEKSIIPSNETEKDANYRGKIMLKEANNNAILVAYNKAGKECNIISQKLVVIYIDEEANTNLKIGDEIVSIENTNVTTVNEAKDIIKYNNVGDKINFEVIGKNNKKYSKYGYLDKDKKIGLLFAYDRVLQTNPSINVKYEKDEYGPSGGLMNTLSIYNKLVSEDITKGYTISGTGTIEEDGSVGEIDGVKYKLKGAVKNKADIFFVPSGNNYKEAKNLKKKNKYKIKVVEVKNIDDALNYLTKIKEK